MINLVQIPISHAVPSAEIESDGTTTQGASRRRADYSISSRAD
jgi:hypothetical protein